MWRATAPRTRRVFSSARPPSAGWFTLAERGRGPEVGTGGRAGDTCASVALGLEWEFGGDACVATPTVGEPRPGGRWLQRAAAVVEGRAATLTGFCGN